MTARYGIQAEVNREWSIALCRTWSLFLIWGLKDAYICCILTRIQAEVNRGRSIVLLSEPASAAGAFIYWHFWPSVTLGNGYGTHRTNPILNFKLFAYRFPYWVNILWSSREETKVINGKDSSGISEVAGWGTLQHSDAAFTKIRFTLIIFNFI